MKIKGRAVKSYRDVGFNPLRDVPGRNLRVSGETRVTTHSPLGTRNQTQRRGRQVLIRLFPIPPESTTNFELLSSQRCDNNVFIMITPKEAVQNTASETSLVEYSEVLSSRYNNAAATSSKSVIKASCNLTSGNSSRDNRRPGKASAPTVAIQNLYVDHNVALRYKEITGRRFPAHLQHLVRNFGTAGVDCEKVLRYARLTTPAPPIDVMYGYGQLAVVENGRHRQLVAILRGEEYISCRVSAGRAYVPISTNEESDYIWAQRFAEPDDDTYSVTSTAIVYQSRPKTMYGGQRIGEASHPGPPVNKVPRGNNAKKSKPNQSKVDNRSAVAHTKATAGKSKPKPHQPSACEHGTRWGERCKVVFCSKLSHGHKGNKTGAARRIWNKTKNPEGQPEQQQEGKDNGKKEHHLSGRLYICKESLANCNSDLEHFHCGCSETHHPEVRALLQAAADNPKKYYEGLTDRDRALERRRLDLQVIAEDPKMYYEGLTDREYELAKNGIAIRQPEEEKKEAADCRQCHTTGEAHKEHKVETIAKTTPAVKKEVISAPTLTGGEKSIFSSSSSTAKEVEAEDTETKTQTKNTASSPTTKTDVVHESESSTSSNVTDEDFLLEFRADGSVHRAAREEEQTDTAMTDDEPEDGKSPEVEEKVEKNADPETVITPAEGVAVTEDTSEEQKETMLDWMEGREPSVRDSELWEEREKGKAHKKLSIVDRVLGMSLPHKLERQRVRQEQKLLALAEVAAAIKADELAKAGTRLIFIAAPVVDVNLWRRALDKCKTSIGAMMPFLRVDQDVLVNETSGGFLAEQVEVMDATTETVRFFTRGYGSKKTVAETKAVEGVIPLFRNLLPQAIRATVYEDILYEASIDPVILRMQCVRKDWSCAETLMSQCADYVGRKVKADTHGDPETLLYTIMAVMNQACLSSIMLKLASFVNTSGTRPDFRIKGRCLTWPSAGTRTA